MLPLTVEITDQNGIQWRPPFRNLKFAKTFYGGEDLWMAFVLDRDGSQDYPDIGYGYDVTLRNGLAPRFAGEIRQIESDLETVTIKVLGRFVYLDDYGYGGAGKLWSESRYGRWKEVTQEMAAAYAPDRFQMDTQNRLRFLPTSGERYSNVNYFGALYYYSPYDLVERISFEYDFATSNVDYAPADGIAMTWELRLYSNNGTPDTWGADDPLLWSVAANGVGVKDITLPTPRALVYFRFMQNGLETYQGRVAAFWDYGIVTNLRLWGESGAFSRAIESPSVIHMGEDIISQVQAATPISADDELVQESVFVRDTFTGPNATSLDARDPDISKERVRWNEVLGNWQLWGNEANALAVEAYAVIDAGVSDGIICADLRSGPGGTPIVGIIFRYIDNTHFWLWDIAPSAGVYRLYKQDAGWNFIHQLNVGMEFNYWYNLMVKLRGDRIDCYIGGIWRYGLNDSFNQAAIHHGMCIGNETDCRLDNFEVFQALPIWPLFYERGQSCHKALKDAASYGDWDFRALGWGIEPGGDRLYLKRAERDRVRYVVPPHHASRLSARGQTDKGYVSEGWGQYIDEDGVERLTAKYYAHVTPTGIVANTTATGDDLASTVYGVFRERAINFGRVDALLAVEYLRQYLEEHAHPQVKSSFEIFGPVQDRFKGGAWIQPYELEMGYVVQIPYFRAVEVEGLAGSDIRWDVGGGSDTTFLLVAMQYDAERGRAKLIPEGASEDLERLMKYTKEFERGQEKSLVEKRREASFSR